MQRVSAFVLLLLFSFSLIATAALNNPDSNLPECCRKDGKHKCAMSSSITQESSEASLRSMAEKCPYSPARGATVAYGKTTVSRAATAIRASVASYPAGLVETEARYRVNFSRSRQKRGPPSLLS